MLCFSFIALHGLNTFSSIYLLDCREQKGLLNNKEGLVAETGDAHATEHPQGLLDAAAREEDCSSHQDVANWLPPDDRLAAPRLCMAAPTERRHLKA